MNELPHKQRTVNEIVDPAYSAHSSAFTVII